MDSPLSLSLFSLLTSSPVTSLPPPLFVISENFFRLHGHQLNVCQSHGRDSLMCFYFRWTSTHRGMPSWYLHSIWHGGRDTLPSPPPPFSCCCCFCLSLNPHWCDTRRWVDCVIQYAEVITFTTAPLLSLSWALSTSTSLSVSSPSALLLSNLSAMAIF